MPERLRQPLETVLAEAPRTDFRVRLRKELEESIAMTTTEAPAAVHTITPYMRVVDVEGLIAFARNTFGAQEIQRTVTSSGAALCVVGLGESRLIFEGATPTTGREVLAALHAYVPDVDATYEDALEAGALAVEPPRDKPYGARDATVRDPAGNLWFIATRRPGAEPPVRLRTVTPWLITKDALGLIDFLKRAFSAAEVGIHLSADGRLLHAALSIGDSVLEFGELEGVPPAAFYLLVPDVDAVSEQAVRAGATLRSDLASRALGRRLVVAEDAWSNLWYIVSAPLINVR